MKILITGGKSSQAFKIIKAFVNDRVILADYGEIPAFSSAQYAFATLGERNDDTIAHNLLKVCLDQEADCLLPLYQFEIEALVKSAMLFEEFNIHVLLPDAALLPLYYKKAHSKSSHWAVYHKNNLLYTSEPFVIVRDQELNGVFYISETDKGMSPTLFTIA